MPVVVDEAYLEFVRDADVADGMAAYRGRDPQGGAAVRGVGHRPGGPGGFAAAGGRGRMLERVDTLVAERERVVAGLGDAGWDVPETQANSCWLPLPADGAAEAFAVAADQAGVAVRPFAGHGVWVTVAEPAAIDVYLRVAAG